MSRWLISGLVLIAAGLLWPVLQKLGLGRLPETSSSSEKTFGFIISQSPPH